MSYNSIIEEVDKYYTEKVKTFGATPKGVDWNSEESQNLRFQELLKLIENNGSFFSVLDYGCGFGSLYEYMKAIFPGFSFTGYDISAEMISRARALHPDKNCPWANTLDKAVKYDYTIASGIFNVKMKVADEEWKAYITDTIHKMDQHSLKGFSFNMLTKYSDKEYMRDYLFYSDPGYWFDYCKRNFSRFVSLAHDYPLYEFTIHVKKI